ncbi:MAG: hypothetical protein WAX19_06285 [Trichococcus flocculiformis]
MIEKVLYRWFPLGCRINQKNPTTGEQTLCELPDNHEESDNQRVNVVLVVG